MKKFKNIVFYFLRKPAFHIYNNGDLVEISFLWFNFIFVK